MEMPFNERGLQEIRQEAAHKPSKAELKDPFRRVQEARRGKGHTGGAASAYLRQGAP